MKTIILVPYHERRKPVGQMGPQLAATIFQKCRIETVVLGILPNTSSRIVTDFIEDYFKNERPIVGFSYVRQNKALLEYAQMIREAGGISYLGGPNADSDYRGEVDNKYREHYFKGWSDYFDFAVQGPAEQAIPILFSWIKREPYHHLPGISFKISEGIFSNPPKSWDTSHLTSVDWNNFFLLSEQGLQKAEVLYAQVLHMIGCPFASKLSLIPGDVPEFIGKNIPGIPVQTKGCAFCAIASDKGAGRKLTIDEVIRQIKGLPETPEGKKIPFEIINEAPIPLMENIFSSAHKAGISLSTVYFLTRADYFVQHGHLLKSALKIASENQISVSLDCIGFESYTQHVLDNLGKGTTVTQNIQAVSLMKEIGEQYPNFHYLSNEDTKRLFSSNHGWILPTPWHTPQLIESEIELMEKHQLFPAIHQKDYSPLSIAHDTAHGKWIRKLENRFGILFPRNHEKIEWYFN